MSMARQKSSMASTLALVALFMMPLAGYVLSRVYCAVSFDMNCSQHLKLAADANSPELALTQLNQALRYMELHGLREGNTGVFIQGPASDVKFWHDNIQACKNELMSLSPTATQLEKTNVLMKLRESLLDGQIVTQPMNIAIFPHNTKFMIVLILGVIFGIAGFAIFLKELSKV